MYPILNCLVLVMSQTIPGAAENQRYDIRIQDATGTRASVAASIDVDGDYLSVRNGGNDLPRGFATFVNLKSVRDERGQTVEFEKDSVTRWKLNRKIQRARIEYDVDFAYTRGSWPSGNEQAGQWEAGALYTVTKPLFVIGSSDSPCEVSFALPAGWRVATPWKELPGRPNVFAVTNESSLTDNTVVIGRFSAQKFVAGPFTFTLATFGRTAGSAPLMSKVLGAVANEYEQFFARYVDGKELLPMQELFATLGIDADFISYTGEGYFRFASPPTALQRREWQRYAGTSQR